MKDSIKQAVQTRYENLIASIAATALTQTDGAAAGAGLAGHRSLSRNRNIHVYIDDSMIIIDMYISVIYGYSVPEVVCDLQERIKKSVESATRFKLKSINVNVGNIIFE